MTVLAELKKLSIQERLKMVEELWESIEDDRGTTPEIAQELERREALSEQIHLLQAFGMRSKITCYPSVSRVSHR